jgi:aconitate hydratase
MELKKLKGTDFNYVDITNIKNIEKFPFSIRILLENILRNYDGFKVNDEHVDLIMNYDSKNVVDKEIPFVVNRILMQDFTGVPAIVDLASFRKSFSKYGDPRLVNPLIPVDLVIDHSVVVEYFGTYYSFYKNVELEYEQNKERYSFLKWAQKYFNNFRLVPPGAGICHQVNLEYLSKVVYTKDNLVFPDTVLGTDSHTPMVNGIGVVGWGVGGIEAEAVMLGQPLYMTLPEVIGVKLINELPYNATATDLVLTITERLRKYGVVGKFVEVFGPALNYLTIPDRATISNMSPEFGSTITYFPIDNQTLNYLKLTNRPQELIDLVERYAKENMLFRENENKIEYKDVIEIDLSKVEVSISGPRRPQDRINLKDIKSKFIDLLSTYKSSSIQSDSSVLVKEKVVINKVSIREDLETYELMDGSVVIAAITSCTNTSNPYVMLAAGILARNAIKRGLTAKKWVKTTLAPGSKVVTSYLEKAGLLSYLEALRFFVSGYGCTTCIGNSGTLPKIILEAINNNDLVVAAVLSGNRNFEARINPNVKMNFLASPVLVVAYALAGRINIDFQNEPLGYDPNGNPVYLKDIYPKREEILELINKVVDPKDFEKVYSEIFEGDEYWKSLEFYDNEVYEFDENSTYIKEAPFFNDEFLNFEVKNIEQARVLLLLGDSITTDHISPAGSIKPDSPAGKYLLSKGVSIKDFNSYGSRRGNHEVMIRGTFANVRLNNLLVNVEGGYTLYIDDETKQEQIMTVYEAAMRYKEKNKDLIIIAGKEYGSGSSRDWAAKGTRLLNVKAVIAKSFERIHRSNLVGMGVLPLQFLEDQDYKALNLTGKELYTILIPSELEPKQLIEVLVYNNDKTLKAKFNVILRLDSKVEIEYYKNGGILQYVFKEYLKKCSK